MGNPIRRLKERRERRIGEDQTALETPLLTSREYSSGGINRVESILMDRQFLSRIVLYPGLGYGVQEYADAYAYVWV